MVTVPAARIRARKHSLVVDERRVSFVVLDETRESLFWSRPRDAGGAEAGVALGDMTLERCVERRMDEHGVPDAGRCERTSEERE
jgi:hypothetical protein